MSASPLNREELLQDSQATLRKVARVLDDLWDLQPFDAGGSECHGSGGFCSNPNADIARVLKDTHREVQALQEGIGALHELLPPARASEILTEVQTRLDRLAHDIGHQGMGME